MRGHLARLAEDDPSSHKRFKPTLLSLTAHFEKKTKPSSLPVLREFIWNDGPFLPPCRKDKEGGEEGERECVATVRQFL